MFYFKNKSTLARVVRPRYCYRRFCLSVCPSVRLSHSWAPPKQYKTSKCILRYMIQLFPFCWN